MATVDFTKPVTSDLRADVLAYIRDATNSQARMFDGDTLLSAPINTVRYISANNRFERWDGAAWSSLNISGNFPQVGGATGSVQYNAGGAFGGDTVFIYDSANNRVMLGSDSASSTKLWADTQYGLTLLTGSSVGTWARGLYHRAKSTQAVTSGAGFYGQNESVNYYRIGLGASWWDPAVIGMKITPSGRVAVGALNESAWGSAHKGIELAAVGNGISCNDSTQVLITSNCFWNGTNYIHARTGVASYINYDAGAFSINVSPSAPAGTAGTFRQTFSAIYNGNVTINSPLSDNTLTVNNNNDGFYAAVFNGANNISYGRVCLLNTTASGGGYGAQANFRHTGVAEWGVGLGDSNQAYFAWYWGGNSTTLGTLTMYLNNAASLVLGNGGTNANFEAVTSGTGTPKLTLHKSLVAAIEISLNSANKFSIGGFSWSADRFTVDSSGNGLFAGSCQAATYVRAGDGSAGNKSLVLWNNNRYLDYYLDADGNNAGLWDTTAGYYRYYTDSSGNFVARGTIKASSDERLKTAFCDRSLTLDQILSIKPEGFVRTDSGARCVGVRAQSVKAVLPEAVGEDGCGYLALDYGAASMVIALSLAREVENQRKTIDKLVRRIDG